MVYPVHEGEAMVSRLMEELTRLDLVEDLLQTRSSTTCAPKHRAAAVRPQGRTEIRAWGFLNLESLVGIGISFNYLALP